MQTSNTFRSGFALIELMMALAIGGFVVLSARTLLVHLGDTAHEIAQSAAAADYSANSERLIRLLAGRVDAATSGSTVEGDTEHARLVTWCDVASGWQERCVVTLSFSTMNSERTLVLSGIGGTVVVRRGFNAGALRYLVDARGGGSWLAEWHSKITTPAALGIIIDRDTLILRIGERG